MTILEALIGSFRAAFAALGGGPDGAAAAQTVAAVSGPLARLAAGAAPHPAAAAAAFTQLFALHNEAAGALLAAPTPATGPRASGGRAVGGGGTSNPNARLTALRGLVPALAEAAGGVAHQNPEREWEQAKGEELRARCAAAAQRTEHIAKVHACTKPTTLSTVLTYIHIWFWMSGHLAVAALPGLTPQSWQQPAVAMGIII